MLNVYMDPRRGTPYLGTRLLPDTLDLVGVDVEDPKEPKRVWWVQAFYSPLPGRRLGGVRAKLVDNKGIVTFCNQRDLEVLVGFASPGDWCKWLGAPYVSPDSPDWYGLCADEEDLLDDLQERELLLRMQHGDGPLTGPLEIVRRVHLEPRMDFEELHVFIWDFDPETGLCPDTRLNTIEKRWVRSHRERLRWDRL